MEEELIAVLASPDEYAYHIGQVASVGTEKLRVARKKISIKSPYVIEMVPYANISRAEYQSGLAPFRIAAGVLLLALLGGITYYLGVYWDRLEPGTTIRVGLLGLGAVYGLNGPFFHDATNSSFICGTAARFVGDHDPGTSSTRSEPWGMCSNICAAAG